MCVYLLRGLKGGGKFKLEIIRFILVNESYFFIVLYCSRFEFKFRYFCMFKFLVWVNVGFFCSFMRKLDSEKWDEFYIGLFDVVIVGFVWFVWNVIMWVCYLWEEFWSFRVVWCGCYGKVLFGCKICILLLFFWGFLLGCLCVGVLGLLVFIKYYVCEWGYKL